MTAEAGERTCRRTGLRTVAAVGQSAFRVAKDRSGALRGPPNRHVGPLPNRADKDPRGRFDTLGSTIYLADSRLCAFAEVLTGFRQERHKLEQVAASIGRDVDEYIEQVTREAIGHGVAPPWTISADWQVDRSIYEIRLPGSGCWVVADHPDTINALRVLAPGLPPIYSGHIEGESRETTTLIAQVIRETELEDGAAPLGIHYRSKTLMGRCWAYWDRRTDEGLAPGSHDLVQLASENVGPDRDFREAASTYHLKVLDGAV